MVIDSRRNQFGCFCLVAHVAPPQAAGRVYAAYGGVYVSVALLWLWAVDSIRPTVTDWVGVGVVLIGMVIIMFGHRHA